MDQSSHIVGSEIENRSFEDLMITPTLSHWNGYKSGTGERFADPALFKQAAGDLEPGPEKRIRSTPDRETATSGQIEEARRITEIQTERLLGKEVFPRLQNHRADHPMSRSRGEVEDQIDLGIGQEVLGRAGLRNPVFLGQLNRQFVIEV